MRSLCQIKKGLYAEVYNNLQTFTFYLHRRLVKCPNEGTAKKHTQKEVNMALVEVTKIQNCTVLTLNQPEQRNTLTTQMSGELIQHINQAEADENIKSVIVTGNGPAFCAGADLGDLLSAGRGEGDQLQQIYAGFLAVANCSLPTIAAINGPAVGAGMNLALACDVRIMAESARLDTRFLKIGLHPGGGHTWMLHREVNWQAAASMLLFGDVITAEDAVRIGLAWKRVANDDLIEAALEFVKQTGKSSRESITEKSIAKAT